MNESITHLLLQLRDPGSSDDAAEALVGIGALAVEPLLAALKDADWGVRHRIVEVLSGIGLPAVARLCRVLEDADPRVRARATEALAKMQSRWSLPRLVLADSTLALGERVAALQSLHNARLCPPVRTTLQWLARGPDAEEREVARSALQLSMLLRPSSPPGEEGRGLLRPFMGGAEATSSDALLRPSDRPAEDPG